MRKKIQESSILFISISKWFLLSTLIGGLVGLSSTIFLKLLHGAILQSGKHPHFHFLLPLAFFLSALIIKYCAPDAEGHGTEKVIEAVHKSSGKIKAAVVPVKLIATIVTLAAGGSAGKEGPCAQIGAGLSSIFADIFKFDDRDRKKLVICGIAAGFAAVFGTPIAGALFGVEVLFVGSILYDVLLPSFIAGITSYHVSSALGITYFQFPLRVVPQFSELFLIEIALAGVYFGLCSLFMIEILKAGKILSDKLKLWPPFKGILGGFLLLGFALAFSKRYLGLGLDTIESSLSGQSTSWYVFILKMISTSITLGFGGSGGIITPIFFVGSSAGALFAQLTGLDGATMAAIGLVSLLAGAANTPIAASIMAIELFGPELAPYAAISCIISFLMTGHRSVYPSQVLFVTKSASIKADVGKEMDRLNIQVNLREKGWSKTIRDFFLRLKNRQG
jgi:H+/Cl- antiporter ClcA